MQPFQTVVPHPGWRAGHGAGVKVKRRSHAQHDRVDPASVCVHPTLLLRATQAHKNQAGSAGVDALHNISVFLLGQRSEGRCFETCDWQGGECGGNVFGKTHECLA